MGAGPALGFLSTFWLSLILLASILAVFARRRARASIVFRHLALIVRQNLPLTSALQCAAASETGIARHILLRLAHRTAQGLPLSEALSTGYPAVPALALSVVQAAERCGTLPDALCELNERLSRRPEPTTTDAAHRWLLYTAILVAFVSLYLGASFLVLPRFVSLLDGVNQEAPLPYAFQIHDIVRAGHPLGPMPQTSLGWIFRALVTSLTVITPLFLVIGLARLRPRQADHVGALAFLRDFLQWHVWPSRKFAWAACCARALSTLRLTLAAGWPLPDALERAAEVDANHFGRRCLRRWAERLRHGENAIAAGRVLRVPEMLLAQMAVGTRDGNLDAPLHFAEDYYRRLEHRWKQFLLQLLWPLTTLYLGAIVGILTVAVFLAIKGMIDTACAAIG